MYYLDMNIKSIKKFWADKEKQSWWKYFQSIDPLINSFIETFDPDGSGISEERISNGEEIRDMKFAVAKEIEKIVDNEEICICAAVKTKDGQVIRGHRHGDCYQTMIRMKLEASPLVESQGFVTSKNRYVTREEGRILQDKAGIKSADPEGYRGKTLFSEDLY